MGLKILHSADWHLDSPFASFREEQREALREAQKALPGRIAELVRQAHCDLVLLAGDLVEGSPGREWIGLLQAAFREMEVPVLIAPGNHDFCAPGCLWLEERWPENVHIFTGGLEAVSLPKLDCRVYGAGYQSMDCPPLLEGFHAEGTERWCIGLLHGDPVVKQSPCCPVTGAQVRESGLDYLALGHIHKAGSFRAGSTLCGWPGCPMGRGWDETGETGVYLVTLEETAELQWLSLPVPRFHSLTVELTGDAAQALEDVLPPAHSTHFFRVTLTGTGDVDLPFLKQKFAHLPNLELRDKTQPPVDLWAQAGEDTLRGVYFRLLRDSEDPHGELAARISAQLLMGREVALP